MPVLPLVDLLILLGTGSLFVGFVLKAVDITTRAKPAILGFSSVDFALMTAVFFGLALTLVARTWLALNAPALQALRRRLKDEEARMRVTEIEQNGDGYSETQESAVGPIRSAARSDQR